MHTSVMSYVDFRSVKMWKIFLRIKEIQYSHLIVTPWHEHFYPHFIPERSAAASIWSFGQWGEQGVLARDCHGPSGAFIPWKPIWWDRQVFSYSFRICYVSLLKPQERSERTACSVGSACVISVCCSELHLGLFFSTWCTCLSLLRWISRCVNVTWVESVCVPRFSVESLVGICDVAELNSDLGSAFALWSWTKYDTSLSFCPSFCIHTYTCIYILHICMAAYVHICENETNDVIFPFILSSWNCLYELRTWQIIKSVAVSASILNVHSAHCCWECGPQIGFAYLWNVCWSKRR